MLELSLVVLVIAAIGGICYWRRAAPVDRSLHTVVTNPQDKTMPTSLTNLPQGSRIGAHRGRTAAVLADGSVLAQSAGGAKSFPSLAAYRDFVGDQQALLFGDQPA